MNAIPSVVLFVCSMVGAECQPLDPVEVHGAPCYAGQMLAAQYAGDHPEITVTGYRCTAIRQAAR